MRIARPFVIAVIVLSALPATAQINPFWGTRTALTQRDVDLLSSSIARLNQSKNLTVDSKDNWSNPENHSRGENVVT